MRIATYNINGVKARLPRLLEWLEETQPDVACLQEVKSQDEGFPYRRLRARGAMVQSGTGRRRSMAWPSWRRAPSRWKRSARCPAIRKTNMHAISRLIFFGVRVASIYLPNGNPQPGPKFDYKLGWMRRLQLRAAELLATEIPAVLAGDYNVIPHPHDMWAPGALLDDALRQPESIAALPCATRPGLDRCTSLPLPARRRLDLLGFPGRCLAARSWLPHRPFIAQPGDCRSPDLVRRRQGASRAAKKPAIMRLHGSN